MIGGRDEAAEGVYVAVFRHPHFCARGRFQEAFSPSVSPSGACCDADCGYKYPDIAIRARQWDTVLCTWRNSGVKIWRVVPRFQVGVASLRPFLLGIEEFLCLTLHHRMCGC